MDSRLPRHVFSDLRTTEVVENYLLGLKRLTVHPIKEMYIMPDAAQPLRHVI
jgi:hypothetical protein